MGFSSSIRFKILDKLLFDNDFTGGALWISLHSENPTETGGREVSGGSYARQQVTWSSISNAIISNDGDLEWEDMPETHVSHVGIYDSSTDGTFYGGGALEDPADIESGQNVLIPSGDLEVTVE